MSYSVFVNDNWFDYNWLRIGCIDEMHFNWFYSLFTANNPHVKQLVKEGPYRQFIGLTKEYLKDNQDRISHTKRFVLHNVDDRFLIYVGDEKVFLL